ANTMTLLAKLVRKNNAKVIMTWATRLEKGKGYELNLQPINILSDSVDLISDVTLMNQTIEKLVRTKPEQYLWNYKRFKSSINY
ncbi:MAG TPA: lipid A biosynthesis acyltransferase, partial [Candidatus Thioglobus sp.]|nr:lipid A biosynthesis acyltransferase [Candidatus Thioglobus sp.]